MIVKVVIGAKDIHHESLPMWLYDVQWEVLDTNKEMTTIKYQSFERCFKTERIIFM